MCERIFSFWLVIFVKLEYKYFAVFDLEIMVYYSNK